MKKAITATILAILVLTGCSKEKVEFSVGKKTLTQTETTTSEPETYLEEVSVVKPKPTTDDLNDHAPVEITPENKPQTTIPCDMYNEYPFKWKTDGELNYHVASLVTSVSPINPEHKDNVKIEQLQDLFENYGWKTDRLWSVILPNPEGKRQSFVTVGIRNGPITNDQAKELHGKIKNELTDQNIIGLKLAVLWYNSQDKNTYSIQLNDFFGKIEGRNFYTGENFN